MCKITKHEYHSTQSPKEEAHNQANQGLQQVDDKPKIQSNQPNSAQHHHGLGLGDHTMKLDSRWASQGAATWQHPPSPTSSGRFIPTYQRRFTRSRPGLVYLHAGLRAVCSFHMGIKHISKDPPALTYKRRLPPHLRTTHKRKSTKEIEEQHH